MGPRKPALAMSLTSSDISELKQLHALIVDDDPDILFLNKHALSDIGIGHVDGVNSVQAMFAYLNNTETPVSLILMDVMMPGANGIDGVRQLSQHPTFSEIPVIMLTTLNTSEKLAEAFDAGATDYMTKPFKYPELKARVLSILKKQRAFDRLKADQNALLLQHQALKQRQRNLERNVYSDGLTNIPNRRAFNDGIERMWERSQKKQEPIGVLLADVDYFKRYNDIYGHQKGDECLQQVANNLPALTADTLPARYGGEEFAVVICGEKARFIQHISQQICERILALRIPHMGSELRPYITLSIGCTYYPNVENLSTETLIKTADEALYKAKQEGRNQVVFYDAESSQGFSNSPV